VPSILARSILHPGERIRVLVVDDSVVIRRLVTHALEEEPSIEVVGSASNGALALERIQQVNPDLMTLDIEMPVMDGLETLRRVRKQHPRMRVIMFSTLTQRGASATFEALALGADDYVTKASNVGSLDRSLENLRMELVPKIRQFFLFAGNGGTAAPATASIPSHAPLVKPWTAASGTAAYSARRVLAVGVSTGGPTALAEILPKLPRDLPVPVVVVQHMPPLFTRLLAERLQAHSALVIEEAKDGAVLEAGRVLIAPGDYHMRVRKEGEKVVARLDQSPFENSCRPAVDVLFRSVDEVYGGSTLALILTGMGQDGLRGCERLKANRACILAQDEASSVVWGMPGAVVAAGLADMSVGLNEMAGEIIRRLGRGGITK
jgi:two-component system chemotaxis response regulator CheB